MMGSQGDQRGIIPRLCEELFQKIEATPSGEHIEFGVEVSYLEIYNEKVGACLSSQFTQPQSLSFPFCFVSLPGSRSIES